MGVSRYDWTDNVGGQRNKTKQARNKEKITKETTRGLKTEPKDLHLKTALGNKWICIVRTKNMNSTITVWTVFWDKVPGCRSELAALPEHKAKQNKYHLLTTQAPAETGSKTTTLSPPEAIWSHGCYALIISQV